jgi:hypothetical protein
VSDNSAELTDEMAVQHWFRIAADTDNFQNREPFPVQPGSELAGDDAQSDPYRVSHCAQGSQNYRDQDRATKDLGFPNQHSLQSNLARVAEVGGPVGCDKKVIRAGYSSTEVLQYAARETSILPSPHLMWQVCSGFAHGRRWASLGMNATEIKPGPDEGVSTMRFTSDHKRLLGAGWPAHGLMTEVVRLFTERAG